MWLVVAPADLVVAVNIFPAQAVPLDLVGAGGLEVLLASEPGVAPQGAAVALPADAVVVLRRV